MAKITKATVNIVGKMALFASESFNSTPILCRNFISHVCYLHNMRQELNKDFIIFINSDPITTDMHPRQSAYNRLSINDSSSLGLKFYILLNVPVKTLYPYIAARQHNRHCASTGIETPR
ncbi:hypothetical protein GCM10007972_25460 [Iodidimonas muriae]|uniref:Uncharacterized protein n=1 Tax=Iodidimonas muriae TaxID=261467 RepID=A0ABQ2LGU3_9PROT|nr:hypothetical protein JCM17843_25990 [Kordiimonadales bacterium JCM 17843]GGO16407.1 hypothetical protein GCM10007972_25460 [Iodidimonas muriae]